MQTLKMRRVARMHMYTILRMYNWTPCYVLVFLLHVQWNFMSYPPML